jgi:hypothetical protein
MLIFATDQQILKQLHLICESVAIIIKYYSPFRSLISSVNSFMNSSTSLAPASPLP